jgi:hypothetical protein
VAPLVATYYDSSSTGGSCASELKVETVTAVYTLFCEEGMATVEIIVYTDDSSTFVPEDCTNCAIAETAIGSTTFTVTIPCCTPMDPADCVEEIPATPNKPTSPWVDESVLDNVAGAPIANCGCSMGSTVGSWKFGTYIYNCPNVAFKKLCRRQLEAAQKVIMLNDTECEQFQTLQLDDKAIPVENEPGIALLGLSNYVCYER